MDMTTVEIEYCVPCGFRERALDVQSAILNGLEQELDELALVMGDHGVFKVRADGDVVYDKEDDEFDVDDIVRELRETATA
jgi:selenoprotein W-related protein